MKYSDRIAVFLSAILMFFGCSDDRHDERLARIAGTVSDSPEEALASLDSISQEELSDADRHFHDLLTIKARDKAYITHTSDSTVLSVIDYYSSHDKDGLYPEALYYGGRVYSDMGDYPTALDYYHKALNRLPNNQSNNKIRGCIIGNIGWLLDKLRLRSQAIPYFKEVIRIDSLSKDTIHYAYDSLWLGGIYMDTGRLDEAEEILKRILKLKLPVELHAHVKTFLAGVMLEKGKINSALGYIRRTPDEIRPLYRNVALSFASEIYYKACILDSAYMYANALAFGNDETNRKNGFKILFSPGIRDMIPKDSITAYTKKYQDVVEEYLNRNDKQQVLIQTSYYNYQAHDRERAKTQQDKEYLLQLLLYCIIAILSLIIVIISMRFFHKTQKFKLIEEINKLRTLKNSIDLSIDNETSADYPNIETGASLPNIKPNCDNTATILTHPMLEGMSKNNDDLREQLRLELLDLSEKANLKTNYQIFESDAYRELQTLIKEEAHIEADNPLWQKMEETVLSVSPKFKSHLQILTGGTLRQQDFRTALLIKFGVTPTQMTTLLCKTKGTISSRREQLGIRIFDRKIGNKAVDNIIKAL